MLLMFALFALFERFQREGNHLALAMPDRTNQRSIATTTPASNSIVLCQMLFLSQTLLFVQSYAYRRWAKIFDRSIGLNKPFSLRHR